MQPTELSGVLADYLHAINAGDLDAAAACFADDGYVNDARREFVGTAAVRRWIAKEMVGDHVQIDVREVLEHHGDLIVRGAYDGTFDKTNLPAELILTSYVSVRDEKIVSLVVIFTRPADC
jgi:ketosteroid isomerase-like protein